METDVSTADTINIDDSQIMSSEEIMTSEEVVTSSTSVIKQIYDIIKPLCDSANLVSELRVCFSDESEFIKIHNPKADGHFKYFPTLHLIVFLSGGHLFLRLFLEHKKVFKESVVRNIEEHLGDSEDYVGIVTVLSAFLSELNATKYNVCKGAFEETNKFIDLSLVDMRSVLIESEDSRIVYRSRQCYLMFRDSIRCDSCSQLLKSVQTGSECGSSVRGSIDDPDMVNGCLEMSMEETVDSENYDMTSPNSGDSHIRYLNKSMNSGKKTSYRKLITAAIEDSPNRMLKLNDIYEWIMDRYPGFRANKTGFQNSIRHNLSLCKAFVKLDSTDGGKGGYWTIDPSLDPVKEKTGRLTKDQGRIVSLPSSTSAKIIKHVTPPQQMQTKRINLSDYISSQQQTVTTQYVPAPNNTVTDTTAPPPKVIKIDSSQRKILESLMQQRKQQGQGVPKTLIIPKGFPLESVNALFKSPEGATINVPVSHQQLPARKVIIKNPPGFSLHQSSTPRREPREDKSNKPSFSYKELIMLAIYSDPNESICLNDVYNNIRYWFPYYQDQSPGSWQNSIRHNLSLNKCFRRETSGSPMKGGYWTFDKDDESFNCLMREPHKWTNQMSRPGLTVIKHELCVIIAEKNESFANRIYPLLPEDHDQRVQSDYHVSLNENKDAVDALLNLETQEYIKEEVEYHTPDELSYQEEVVTSS